MGAALPGERSRLHQRPDALLDEEGVAASDQQPPKRLERRVVTQKRAQEIARTLGWERIKPHLAVIGLARPAVLVLGPIVDQQEEPSRWQALDQAVEQGLSLGVDPVQVLEDDEERLGLTLPEEETPDRIEHALAALGRIERLPRSVLDRHVEQGQQSGQGRLQRTIQGELASHLLADLALGLALVHLEVGAEEVDDRQVAGGLA